MPMHVDNATVVLAVYTVLCVSILVVLLLQSSFFVDPVLLICLTSHPMGPSERMRQQHVKHV